LDGVKRVDRKIQSGVKPPQSKKEGSGLNFWKMITFAPSRETLSPSALQPLWRLGGGRPTFFLIHPDSSAAAFKTIEPFFNGGL
jgi:hypothetical protein